MINIINIFFRFLDFFVIAGLLIYAVIFYLIPGVEKMFREYGVFLYNLESDCKDLQLQTQAIYENIQDQDRQFLAMQARFAVWQKKCHEQVIIQKKEQELTDVLMQQRCEIQSDFIKNDKLLQRNLPSILDSVTSDLQIKYRASENQKQYIDTLVGIMKEPS